MAQEDEWELSKENVQPLRQGRNVANLSLALQSSSSELYYSILRNERQKYEISLRTYDGDDPLSVWDEYIKWTEQYFPKGGKDSNLSQLLELCVSKFKDEEKYKNDERYLQIWLKFANFCSEPLDIFSFLYDQKIGSKIALLYEAWSSEFERLGSHKRANLIFEQGIQMGAQPLDHIKKKHSEFQTRVARLTMYNMGNESTMETTSEESERSALGELKGRGAEARVANDRVAGARSGQRGLQLSSVKQLGNHDGPGFSVFTDDNAAPTGLPAPAGEWSSVPGKTSTKENQQKAGVWTDAKVKQKHVPVVDVKDVSRHCQNQFEVFIDTNTPQPLKTPRKPIEVNQVLSARKPSKPVDPFRNLQNLNEPVGQIPMYPKHKVYAGAREMSLEELRAVEWYERQRKAALEEKAAALLKQEEELVKQKEAFLLQQKEFLLKQEQFMLQQQNVQLRQMQELAIQDGSREKMDTSQATRPRSRSPVSMAESQESSLSASKSHKEQSNLSSIAQHVTITTSAPSTIPAANRSSAGLNSSCTSAGLGQSGSSNGSAILRQSSLNSKDGSGSDAQYATGNIASNTSLATPNVSLLKPTPDSNLHSGSRVGSMRSLDTTRSGNLSAPSPTVNTREALQLMCGMFYSDNDLGKNLGWDQRLVEAEEEYDEFAVTRVEPSKPKPFEIFSDNPATNDNLAPAPFQIFDENALAEKKETNSAPFKIFDENQAPAKKYFQIFDENAQNAPFKIYSENENSGTTKATGFGPKLRDRALDPEYDESIIKQVPLKEEPQPMTMLEKLQKANMDWDVGEHTQIMTGDEIQNEMHDFDGGDMTFAPGLSSTVNFTAAARLASTPFHAGSDMAAFPEPPISHIKPVAQAVSCNSTVGNAEDESSVMARSAMQANEKRRASTYVEGAITNLSPIMEQSDEDKNQTGLGKSSNNVFANVTGRDHYASHSHINNKDIHGSTSADQSSVGAPTPKPPAFSTSEQSTQHRTTAPLPDVPEEEVEMRPAPKNPFAKPTTSPTPEYESDPDEKPGNITAHRHQLNNMTMHEIDITNYMAPKEEIRRQQFLMDQSVAIDPNDPFDEDLVAKFLARLENPIETCENFVRVKGPMPSIKKVPANCELGDDMYYISAKLGEGAFANVFQCLKMEDASDDDMDLEEGFKVIKVQLPACPWEFYITHELQERLSKLKCDYDIRPGLMRIEKGYFFDNGSCLVNEFHSNGTLLDLVNRLKEIGFSLQKKSPNAAELLIIYMTIELLQMAEKLQETHIIHGDIKPDNILITNFPDDIIGGPEQMIRGGCKMLKLIDFGRSIDLKMFPENTTFTVKVTTSGFQCIEMMTNRPWTYQTDWFGIIGCIHVLLFAEYMKVYQEGCTWKATRMLTRYTSSNVLYKNLFHDLLNITSCDQLPDLASHRKGFEKFFLDNLKTEKAQQDFRKVLKNLSVELVRRG